MLPGAQQKHSLTQGLVRRREEQQAKRQGGSLRDLTAVRPAGTGAFFLRPRCLSAQNGLC